METKNEALKILLIEDNPGDARILQEMLVEAKGIAFELEQTDRLSTGLERLTTDGIDVVLLDLSLPDSHGIETFAQVLAKAPQVPVIVLSGLADEALAVNTVRAGAQDYLVKGQVDSNLLVRAIQYAIERKQAEVRQGYYLQTEHVLRQMSSRFVDLTNLNQAIRETLRDIAMVLHTDRVHLFTLSDDATISSTHEWLAGGIASRTEELQRLDAAALPWWMNMLSNNEAIAVSDISELPEPERETLKRFDISSILAVPVFAHGTLYGFYGFEETKQRRKWESQEIGFLRNAAEILGRAIERMQAEQFLQQRNLELASLNAVAEALSVSLDLKDLLDEALSRTIHALGHIGGMISLADRRSGELTLFSYANLPQSLVGDLESHGMGGTLSEFVYKQEKPLRVEDLRKGAPVDTHAVLEAGLRSYVGTPIVHKERVLGTLCLFDTAPHPTSESDQALLTAIAQQIGIAVENARLFEDVAREREVAHTLLDTAEALNTTLQLDQLLERVLDELQRVVPYDSASISLLHDQRLSPQASDGGFSPSAWIVASRGLERISSEGFVWEEMPLIQRVVQERKPVIVPDLHAEANWRSPVEELGPVRSWLCVPLVSKNTVLGILMVESHQPNAYDDETARLAFAFAHHVAIAIDNSRLYEQTRAQLREAVLLHGMTAALSSTLDMDQMLPYVARSLCEAMNSTRVEIYRVDEEANTITVIADYATSGPAEEHHPNAGRTHSLDDFHAAAESLGWSRPVQIRSNDPDTEPQQKAALEAHEAQAALLLPMAIHGHMVGLATVWERDGPRRFTSGEIALGQTLTHQAAIAMENAGLFEEVESARVELQQRAEALEEANVRLQELDRLKSQFLANMSHELRTPLNSVIGFSEVLVDGLMGELSSEQKECTQNILYSGEHLLALINDVLDLSKIEAGRMTLEPAPFDVADWLKEAQATAKALFDKKSQVLEVKVADGLPPLCADRFRIKQVLLNLLSNANKFTPEEGLITLTCRMADPNTMLFAVTDTGVGIKAEDQEIIFEEFRQAGDSSKKVKGTGLGLAISRKLVELHRGRIWVESEYGHGATFSFLLPIVGPPVTAPEADKETTQPTGNKTVLVVDDDRQFSNLLAFYLRQEGYTPVQHYTGANVLERTLEVIPAFITLDLMLPERDGWKVIDDLKSDPRTKGIPVLVISAVKDGELALSLGAADYLFKPVHRNDLHNLLSRLEVPEPEGRKIRVLVVDDDPDVVQLLEAMLPADRYEMFPAYDGEQGLGETRSKRPDMILLDLMMPGTSGFEMLERLRDDLETASIPVVVLTAIDVTLQQRQFLDENTQGILLKSQLTPQVLLAKLRCLEEASPSQQEASHPPSSSLGSV